MEKNTFTYRAQKCVSARNEEVKNIKVTSNAGREQGRGGVFFVSLDLRGGLGSMFYMNTSSAHTQELLAAHLGTVQGTTVKLNPPTKSIEINWHFLRELKKHLDG